MAVVSTQSKVSHTAMLPAFKRNEKHPRSARGFVASDGSSAPTACADEREAHGARGVGGAACGQAVRRLERAAGGGAPASGSFRRLYASNTWLSMVATQPKALTRFGMHEPTSVDRKGTGDEKKDRSR